MISARKEAKALSVWLFCISLFVCGAFASLPFLGLFSAKTLYKILPFLNFGITVEGSLFGWQIPEFVTENFSFWVSMACIMAAFCLLMHFIYVIVLSALRSQRKKAKKALKKYGYGKEYFYRIEKKRKQLAGKSLAAKNDLLAAKEYCDGRDYETALSILRDIDIEEFDSKDAQDYYTIYAYAFVLTGNFENAKQTLALGEKFFSKKKAMPWASLVNAIICYAEKNYDKAKDGFKSLLVSKNLEVRVWAGMYLSLLYLRQHRKERAKNLATELANYRKTPRQSEDMLKLLNKIEAAYVFAEQEEAEERAEAVAMAEAEAKLMAETIA